MGSYSCSDGSLPFLRAADVTESQRINEATIEALRRETGHPYRGVLYGGFMAVADGVRLIEYNARFGDPEAMNVLPLLTNDLVDVLLAAASGTLGGVEARFGEKATVCKYVVPRRYPEGPDHSAEGATDDDPITVEASVLGPELRCYWSAAELEDNGQIRLTGSRGLAFLGIADTLAEAEALAERGASSVGGSVRHRSDVGTAGLLERRMEHMRHLRPAPGTH
jgi:phosphoribosylamine--glycine ligase